MENQKYISEINNIISKQKIKGGLGTAAKAQIKNMASQAAKANIKKIDSRIKAPGHLIPPNSSSILGSLPKIPTEVSSKILGSLPKIPTEVSSKIPGALTKMPTEVSSKIQDSLPKMPTDVSSKMPIEVASKMPMDMPDGSSPNSELKNMVKDSSDFEEYINQLDNYIQMLGNCKKSEIQEFIKKNNNTQQQISNNAEVENNLTNQQLDDAVELSNTQEDISTEKVKLDEELKVANEGLVEQEKKEAKLMTDFENLKKEKIELENKLEEEKKKTAQDGKPSNNTETAELQKKLDELRSTEQEKLNELEKEKKELENKYNDIMKTQDVGKAKIEETEKKAEELRTKIENDAKQIQELRIQNQAMQDKNNDVLKQNEINLAEKDAKIKEIQKQLDEKKSNAEGQGNQKTEDIQKIKSEKKKVEFERNQLRNQITEAQNVEKEKEIQLSKINKEKKELEEQLAVAKQDGKSTNNDETNALKNKLKQLEVELEAKVAEKKSDEDAKKITEDKIAELNKTLSANEKVLQQKDLEIIENKKKLEEITKLQSNLEHQKVELRKELTTLQETNANNTDFKKQLDDMQQKNTDLMSNIQAIKDKEQLANEELNKTIEQLRITNKDDKTEAKRQENLLRQQFTKESQLLRDQISELRSRPTQIPQPQNISTNNYNDSYRYSGFTLSFPALSKPREDIFRKQYIKLVEDPKNKTVKLCTNSTYLVGIDSKKNSENYNYLINNANVKNIVLTGVNNYKLWYTKNIIEENQSDAVYLTNKPANSLSPYITPKNITPEQFTILLQATDSNKCMKLEFTELNDNTSIAQISDNPKIVYIIPQSLDKHSNRHLIREQIGGNATNMEDNEKVLSMTKFKEIKESIDIIIQKIKEYQKKLLKEKRGNVKYKTKLEKITKLIEISKKINVLYEGTRSEKIKDSISNIGKDVKNMGTGAKNLTSNIGTGAKNLTSNIGTGAKKLTSKLKGMKRGGSRRKNTTISGGAFANIENAAKNLNQIKPDNIPPIPNIPKVNPREIWDKIKTNKRAEALDDKNKDKNSKELTKKKCMKIVKYLENFNEILKNLQNDTGDVSIEQIKTDATKVGTDTGKNELIDKMMSVQKSFNPTSSDGKPNNSTEILTISTMIIYDILLISIVIICIIIYILFVINIIKFLYQCFLEVGNSQHNNLSTGDTLRYKLLGYVVYINNCNLPGLFSSFNSVDSPSGTFMKLSKVLEQYFTNKKSSQDDNTFESIFSELADKVESPKTPQEKAEEKQKKWLKEGGIDKTIEEQEGHKDKLIKEEIESDQERKNTQYEENKNYKEPKFNIFLCIRLIFICIKLFITFITIIVISIITFILLSVVSQMANMDAIEIQIIKKQKLFFMLLQLLVVSIINIFIKLLIYKTMFVKIYNKYLNTYLNIIAIDLKINSLKKSDDLQYIDTDLATILKNSVDNDLNIEDRLIQLINKDGVTNETIVKYITIYMLLKYLYSYDKNKSKYLLYYSYFINDDDNSFPSELNMEKNNITTFYSLIPNKHRKTPINYFKYSDIKNINNIENAEKIRQDVNTNISQINTHIAEANSYFDDDNFIVSLGWYILINIILGTIYIIIIVTIILKETGIMNGSFNFEEFIRFE